MAGRDAWERSEGASQGDAPDRAASRPVPPSGSTVLLGEHDDLGAPAVPETTANPVARWAARAVLVVSLLAAVQLVLQAVTLVLVRQVAPVGPSPSLRLPATHLPQILEATKNGGGYTVYLDELPLSVRLVGAAPGVAKAVVLVVAALLVARLLRGLGGSRPFGAATPRLLGQVGLALSAGGLLVGLLDHLAVRRAIAGVSDATGVISLDGFQVATPSWPWLMIVTGVVVLALRATFREGSRLQDEVDSVV